jgi:hypothetical protein
LAQATGLAGAVCGANPAGGISTEKMEEYTPTQTSNTMSIPASDDVLYYLAEFLPLQLRSQLGKTCRYLRGRMTQATLKCFHVEFFYGRTNRTPTFYIGDQDAFQGKSTFLVCAADITDIKQVNELLFQVRLQAQIFVD